MGPDVSVAKSTRRTTPRFKRPTFLCDRCNTWFETIGGLRNHQLDCRRGAQTNQMRAASSSVVQFAPDPPDPSTIMTAAELTELKIHQRRESRRLSDRRSRARKAARAAGAPIPSFAAVRPLGRPASFASVRALGGSRIEREDPPEPPEPPPEPPDPSTMTADELRKYKKRMSQQKFQAKKRKALEALEDK